LTASTPAAIIASVSADPAEWLVVAWVLAVGAAVGSFLNVVVARVPEGRSIVSPGSRCPRCGAAIRWYDNVPVISWVVLRARCRSCGAGVSARYPLVEALVAILALLAWSRHGFSLPALAELAFAALVVALAFIDLDTWLLPHALTWPLLALGLAAGGAGLSPAGSLASAAVAAAVGWAAFAAVSIGARWVLRKDALGFGDVWLLAGLGAWLGVAALLPVVLLASVQGSVVGIVLLAVGRALGARPPASPGAADLPGKQRDDVLRPPEAAPSSSAGLETSEAAEPPVAAGDERPALEEEDAWVPPRTAVPFGPFLALGALEWLYLRDLLAELVPSLAVFR
jgi:leader peptidase (prepilin peptidase)/N-methyltransferase